MGDARYRAFNTAGGRVTRGRRGREAGNKPADNTTEEVVQVQLTGSGGRGGRGGTAGAEEEAQGGGGVVVVVVVVVVGAEEEGGGEEVGRALAGCSGGWGEAEAEAGAEAGCSAAEGGRGAASK